MAASASRTSGLLLFTPQSNTMTAPILILITCLYIAQAAIFGPLAAVRYTASIITAAAGLWLAAVLAAAF